MSFHSSLPFASHSVVRLARTAVAVSLFCLLLAGQTNVASAQKRVVRPGVQPDGSTLLPNGWSLTPAGKQVPVSTLPMSLALSPDEKYLLVLNGGYLPPSISVIDVATESEVQRLGLPDAWLGLAFHPNGKVLYVGGGSEQAIFELEFYEGRLRQKRRLPVIPKERRRPSDHIGDVLISPDGRYLYVANVFADTVAILNAASGVVVGEIRTGRRPYRLRLGLDPDCLLVSHWGESTVGLYSISERRLLQKLLVGPHPTDMVLQPVQFEPSGEGDARLAARLFVACAHTNSVWILGATEGQRFQALDQVIVGPTPRAPLGSLPTALALGPRGNLLYTVLSGNNAVVVADASEQRVRLLGALPTGWFPTAVAAASDGRLFYANGKGGGSLPLPDGPNPTQRSPGETYLPAKLTGTLGIIKPLDPSQILRLTQQVTANTPYSDRLLRRADVPPKSPIPAGPDGESPIEHVVYVIKENRTYDQVFGDLPEGEGDPSLVVFGEKLTPNHRRLAAEFVLFDNFYTDGSVSADGQNWSVAAVANDFVEKLWPSYYGRRRPIEDTAGHEPTAYPPAGYLWTNAVAAGISVRTYGVWSKRAEDGRTTVLDPGLRAHAHPDFAPFDLEYREQERVKMFLSDHARLEEAGRLPRLMVVRLPGDHTAGKSAGFLTAEAMMAEHDYALGRLVEGVSRSRSWGKTAIFVVEDDAQDGADHIDAHRSILLVASPYARRGFVDRTHYSTASVLRTIELILGLRPMTQFDASAKPLGSAFVATPDGDTFEAVKPPVDLEERNPGSAGRPRRVEMQTKEKQELADSLPSSMDLL